MSDVPREFVRKKRVFKKIPLINICFFLKNNNNKENKGAKKCRPKKNIYGDDSNELYGIKFMQTRFVYEKFERNEAKPEFRELIFDLCFVLKILIKLCNYALISMADTVNFAKKKKFFNCRQSTQ
jgi:hypothetical protein